MSKAVFGLRRNRKRKSDAHYLRTMRHCCGKPIARRKQRGLRRVPGPSASGRLQRALPIEGKTKAVRRSRHPADDFLPAMREAAGPNFQGHEAKSGLVALEHHNHT